MQLIQIIKAPILIGVSVDDLNVQYKIDDYVSNGFNSYFIYFLRVSSGEKL